MLDALKKNEWNIVFGNRFLDPEFSNSKIPFLRNQLLRTAVIFEKIITGIHLGDAHNGLRVFDSKAASVIKLTQDRMTHATEFKFQVRSKKLKYGEESVNIIYSKESLQAGQGNSDAVRILIDLVKNWWLS